MVEVVVLRTDKGITSYAYKPQRGRKEERRKGGKEESTMAVFEEEIK